MSNSSSVTSGNRGTLAWYNSSNSTVANIRATAVTDNVGTQLEFYTRPAAGSLTQVLTLASTGAATFSSSVTAGGNILTSASQVDIIVNATSTSQYSRYTFQENGTEKAGLQYLNSAFGTTARRNKLEIFNGGGVNFITQGNFSSPDVVITSNGNVGIGTSSPQWMFEITKDTTSGSFGQYPAISVNNPNASGYTAYYFFSGTTNKGGIEYYNGDNSLRISANSAEKMRIDSSAANVVTLRGTQGTQGSYFSSIEFNNSGNVAAAIRPIRYNDETAADLSFWTREYLGSLTQRFTIARNGVSTFTSSVLTNSPSEGATGEGLIAGRSFKIDATGTGQSAKMYVVTNTLSDTYGSAFQVQFANLANTAGFGFNINTSGGYETYIKNGSGSWERRMTITSGGNVLIYNTYTTPSKLNVH